MNKPILLDAIFINNSGGKVLLDYLIEKLEKENIRVYYLLDKRIINNHPPISDKQEITYLKPSLFLRHMFYHKNKEKFNKILCFANLPPTLKINATIYTYFHQPLFIKIPAEISLKQKLILRTKIGIIQHVKKNTSFWIVQSEQVRIGLAKRYNLAHSKIFTVPFYRPICLSPKIKRNKDRFLYVSNSGMHKNHIKLLKAFCRFFDEYKSGQLELTVPLTDNDLSTYINSLQSHGYPIINHGFVSQNELSKIYASAEFLIFPSLAESFGLGLIEGIESGCKVIGADLPYTYAVCTPSLTFDPNDEDSIYVALTKCLSENIKPSVLKVNNEIERLFKHLV